MFHKYSYYFNAAGKSRPYTAYKNSATNNFIIIYSRIKKQSSNAESKLGRVVWRVPRN